MQHARILWRDQQPYSQDFNDIYYSTAGGPAESEYVFLKHNHLPQRWQHAKRFIIGETGFGTGLNFLVTVDHWLRTSRADACLVYFSVENFPLCKTDLARLWSTWPHYTTVANELLANWPGAVPGMHHICMQNNRVVLCLMLGDVLSMLPEMQSRADAWYLDGFAPQRNPQMWTRQVMQAIADNSHAQTSFSTYTSASHVMHNLQAAGFAVNKVAGFAHKRNMLCGQMQSNQLARADVAPWFALPKITTLADKVAVIGAGLAGVTTAWRLAQQGVAVDLFDSAGEYAQAASGNPCGVLYPRVSTEFAADTAFYSSAFFFTLRKLAALQQTYPDLAWQQTGVIQLLTSARLQKYYAQLTDDNDVVRRLTADAANCVSGIALNQQALFYSQAGWLSPRQLCAVLLHDAGQQLHQYFNTAITRLELCAGQWQLHTAAQQCYAGYAAVVVATAENISQYAPTNWLGVQPARGQISYLAATAESGKLTCPVCYDGYILPALAHSHVVGASFVPSSVSCELELAEHAQNISGLRQAIPALTELADYSVSSVANGRAAVRAVTSDHLPLVGAVPDRDFYRHHYSDLRHGKPATQYPAAQYLPGLYVNSGHGSRGFSSVFIAAELLTAMITNQVLPLTQTLQHALHPARFFIRQSKKGKLES